MDARNRPALVGSIVAGIAVVVVLRWFGLPLVLAWLLGWAIPTFALYGIDKRQARAGGWRVPELLLHALALVGGVMGAWVGRAVFRHKTHKPIFLAVLVIASVAWAVILAWTLLP